MTCEDLSGRILFYEDLPCAALAPWSPPEVRSAAEVAIAAGLELNTADLGCYPGRIDAQAVPREATRGYRRRAGTRAILAQRGGRRAARSGRADVDRQALI